MRNFSAIRRRRRTTVGAWGSAFDGNIVLFCAGQSNMDNGLISDGVPSHYSTLNSKIRIWVSPTGWATYNPATNASQQAAGVAYGPEAECAYQFATAYPNATIYIIKYAAGATSLEVNWNPPSGGSWTGFLTDYANPAVANLNANSITLDRKYFLWMQGETDSVLQASADNYQTNFTDLLAEVRTQLGSDVRIVVGRISDQPASGYPFRSTVRAAQLAVANATSNCDIISTDTLAINPSSVPHFTKQGFEDLGLWFYQGCRDIYNDSPVAPSITWGGSYTGGSIPENAAAGTTIGTLSGSPGSIVGGTVTFSEASDSSNKVQVSGSNLQLQNTVSNGVTYNFSINTVNNLGKTTAASFSMTGAPSAGFTDPNYFGSALIGWWTLNDSGSFTQSGGSITAWSDKGPGGLNLTVVGTPNYSATSFNGRPGVTLDTGDYFHVSKQLAISKWGVFAAAAMSDGGASFSTLVTHHPASDTATEGGTSPMLLCRDSANVGVRLYGVSGAGGTKTITANTPSRIMSIADGTNHTMYVDNVAGTPAAYTSAFNNAADGRFVIGRSPAGIRPWLYQPFAEIFIVDLTSVTLDSTLRTQIDDYLKAQWGL